MQACHRRRRHRPGHRARAGRRTAPLDAAAAQTRGLHPRIADVTDEATPGSAIAAALGPLSICIATVPEVARDMMVGADPHRRVVTGDEVAAMALWLCGPGSDSMHGQGIEISGGRIRASGAFPSPPPPVTTPADTFEGQCHERPSSP